jgi:molybdopterin synthase sulfur carrier subunit
MPAPTASDLRVRIRLFASLREAMGWGDQLLSPTTVPATPRTLWRQLGLMPGEPPAGIRVAINQQFADWQTPLSPGDELAFLPPISGG